jgi:hypothetical protein
VTTLTVRVIADAQLQSWVGTTTTTGAPSAREDHARRGRARTWCVGRRIKRHAAGYRRPLRSDVDTRPARSWSDSGSALCTR